LTARGAQPIRANEENLLRGSGNLDGYIAGPKGEADWIVIDPEIDFEAFFKRFDTVLWDAELLQPWKKRDKDRCPAWRHSFFLARSNNKNIPT
jgi:hypothetical protein